MQQTADEIKRLRGCINDLISVLALPAIWIGHDPAHIASTLLDVLLRMLRLDFAYVRLSDVIDGLPLEALRTAQRGNGAAAPQDVGRALARWLTSDLPPSPFLAPNPIGAGEVSIALFRLGLRDEVGIFVAGSQRADFPTATETLLLEVAVNQAAMGLQEARLLSEQRRAAEDLEQRVVERTRQLTAANEELRKEIVERQRAEEQVRKSEERWRAIFENSAVGITMLDFSGRFLAANAAYEDMLGYSEEELQALSFMDLTHEDDRAANWGFITELLETHRPSFVLAKRYWHKDGHLIWGNVHMSLVPGTRIPRFIMAVVEDITERKRAEEALRQTQAELAHVSRVMTMGALTASIAHEVNQPLTGVIINGNASLRWLAREAPDLDVPRVAVERMIRDANRASEVIQRIRALVKKTDLQKAWLDINSDVIHEVAALVQSEVRKHRVVLHMELSAALPPVLGDRVQLQQVLLNLLLNGIEAMHSTDRPRELRIISKRPASDTVLVAVQDSGIGLDPQSMTRLFNPFFTTKPGGLGMGLSISRSISEAHGGQLWASPNTGPGATFQLTLPTGGDRVSLVNQD